LKAPYVYSGVGEEVGVETLIGRGLCSTIPPYLAVVEDLYQPYLCRVCSYPEPPTESMPNMAVPACNAMSGPDEFTCAGTLGEWDRRQRQSQRQRTLLALITVGGHDEVRPFCAEVMLRGIRNFEPMIFEDSSHSAHLKDLVRYLAPLPGCLARVDTTEAA
jgi:hypothetical protein